MWEKHKESKSFPAQCCLFNTAALFWLKWLPRITDGPVLKFQQKKPTHLIFHNYLSLVTRAPHFPLTFRQLCRHPPPLRRERMGRHHPPSRACHWPRPMLRRGQQQILPPRNLDARWQQFFLDIICSLRKATQTRISTVLLFLKAVQGESSLKRKHLGDSVC